MFQELPQLIHADSPSHRCVTNDHLFSDARLRPSPSGRRNKCLGSSFLHLVLEYCEFGCSHHYYFSGLNPERICRTLMWPMRRRDVCGGWMLIISCLWGLMFVVTSLLLLSVHFWQLSAVFCCLTNENLQNSTIIQHLAGVSPQFPWQALILNPQWFLNGRLKTVSTVV